jgi:hypothetical protein
MATPTVTRERIVISKYMKLLPQVERLLSERPQLVEAIIRAGLDHGGILEDSLETTCVVTREPCDWIIDCHDRPRS